MFAIPREGARGTSLRYVTIHDLSAEKLNKHLISMAFPTANTKRPPSRTAF
jgi:hypothetical protein